MNDETSCNTDCEPGIFSRLNMLDSMINQIEDKLFPPSPEKESSIPTPSTPIITVIHKKLDRSMEKLEKISKELSKI